MSPVPKTERQCRGDNVSPFPPGTPVSYSVQLISARLPVQTLTEHEFKLEGRQDGTGLGAID